MDNPKSLERRISELEIASSAMARDIAWMRENLTLARSQHNWNIATIISVLGATLALIMSFVKR